MSMTREQMMRYMEDPALLNERTLNELKEILQEFPYFHAAHLLYMRNLSNENNFRFSAQLRISALHTPDRSVLYHLLHPKTIAQLQSQPVEPEIKIESHPAPATQTTENIPISATTATFELAEELPITESTIEASETKQTDKKEKTRFDLLHNEPTERVYRLEGAEPENEVPLSELAGDLMKLSVKKRGTPNDSNDLVSKFLRDNPVMPSLATRDAGGEELPPVTDEGPRENDDFITETLAKIYLKQGFYQKAIKAFQRLSLKYPEKSIYFARQIEEITKLINK